MPWCRVSPLRPLDAAPGVWILLQDLARDGRWVVIYCRCKAAQAPAAARPVRRCAWCASVCSSAVLACVSHCVAEQLGNTASLALVCPGSNARVGRHQAFKLRGGMHPNKCFACKTACAGAAGNVGNLPMVLVAGLCSDAAGQLLPLRPSADACAEVRTLQRRSKSWLAGTGVPCRSVSLFCQLGCGVTGRVDATHGCKAARAGLQLSVREAAA